jgi:hypothetical protein
VFEWCDCDGNVLDECEVCGGDNSLCTGCSYPAACNYNSNVTIDDGSCFFPEQFYDCEGNCTAAQDCAGVCGGSAVEDACGICGGNGSSCNQDVFGCPDPDACNYDSDATIDNGSCLYEDCEGECGGAAEYDECGVCNGDGTSCEDLGDLNGDGVINVLDIVLTLDLILNENYSLIGDINSDGYLNHLLKNNFH